MATRRERDVEFSQPVRPIALMVIALIAVLTVGWLLYEPIETVFRANLYLNGLIVGVFAIGVLACFRMVLQLVAAVSWIDGFATDRAGHEFVQPPKLLTSLASLLRDSRSRASVSATSARVILDSIAIRLDEGRDITRYLANLLIFLGLLGTFWGLSLTVPAVVDTIRSLAPDDGESAGGVFDRLMIGLEEQLGGMGTAFASSLLGLAGSLAIGLLELFAGHAQNRFYRQLEEWLSSITRIGFGGEEGGEAGLAGALVEQNAAQIEALAALLERNDDKRAAFEERIADLTDRVSRLAGLEEAEGSTAQRQIAVLERIAERLDRRGGGDDAEDFESDAEVRARIRNIDRQLLRMLEEMATGRQDAVAELRAELSQLNRTLVRLAGEGAERR